jgi:hypothetical protein
MKGSVSTKPINSGLDCKVQRGALANPPPTRSRFSSGKRLPSRKARSTRARLILFGTPTLRQMVADHQGGEHQGGMSRFVAGISESNAVKLPRRQFLHLAAGAAVLPAVSRTARAQTYPF